KLSFGRSIAQPLRTIFKQRDKVLEAAAKDGHASRENFRRALIPLEGVREVSEHILNIPKVAFSIRSRDAQRFEYPRLLTGVLEGCSLRLCKPAERALQVLNGNVCKAGSVSQPCEYLSGDARP